MNSTQRPDASEKKTPSAAARLENSNNTLPDKVIIPDECGDSLWDEVLAQQSALSEIMKKPAEKSADGDAGNIQS